MAKLDLQEQYISFVRQTIQNILPDIEIYIFGSRTQGKACEYSDVDIALKGEKTIPFNDFLKIRSEFEDSTFPYKVDIVDLNELDESFLKIITPDLYRIS